MTADAIVLLGPYTIHKLVFFEPLPPLCAYSFYTAGCGICIGPEFGKQKSIRKENGLCC